MENKCRGKKIDGVKTEMKYLLGRRETDVRIIQINDEERHTEARTTWNFLSLILYLCTTLNTLSLEPHKC